MLSTFFGEHPLGEDLGFHKEPCALESSSTRNGFLVSFFCILSAVHVVTSISSSLALSFLGFYTRPVSSRRVALLGTVTVLLDSWLVQNRHWPNSAQFAILPLSGILQLLGVPTDTLLCLCNILLGLLGICGIQLDRC